MIPRVSKNNKNGGVMVIRIDNHHYFPGTQICIGWLGGFTLW